MKRHFGLLLVVILILTCFASCTGPTATEVPTPTQEPFTLHNGVRFGMTHDEVIQIEEANGVTLEVADKSLYWPSVDSLESKGWISIAGQPGSNLYYVFDDDRMILSYSQH